MILYIYIYKIPHIYLYLYVYTFILLSIYLDMTGLIIEVILPECNESINTKSNLLPLKIFLKEILKRSRTSYSTLQTALFYLFRIRQKIEGLKNQLLTSIPTESLRKSVM